MFSYFLLLPLITCVTSQSPPRVPPGKKRENKIQFHEPSGHTSTTTGKGHPPKFNIKPRHQDIRVNIEKEREWVLTIVLILCELCVFLVFRHIKAQVKEDYMDVDMDYMDDNKLLMQYFRRHDSDNNHKLDGLELLKAIVGMEGSRINWSVIRINMFHNRGWSPPWWWRSWRRSSSRIRYWPDYTHSGHYIGSRW